MHLVGGFSSLVATTYLGPRSGIRGKKRLTPYWLHGRKCSLELFRSTFEPKNIYVRTSWAKYPIQTMTTPCAPVLYIKTPIFWQGSPETVVMGNPTFCCAGLFITWWGYLAMNSASTLGVEGTRLGRLHEMSIICVSISGGSSLPRGLSLPWPVHLVAALQVSFLTTSSMAVTLSMLARWSPQSLDHWFA